MYTFFITAKKTTAYFSNKCLKYVFTENLLAVLVFYKSLPSKIACFFVSVRQANIKVKPDPPSLVNIFFAAADA